MKDLANARWIKLKGLLFLVMGLMASALLLAMHFDGVTAALLAIAVWSFCRFYYFAFYVIEKYVDGRYRFSGLGSFARYLLSGRTAPGEIIQPPASPTSTDEAPRA
jgi:hypothetical protein